MAPTWYSRSGKLSVLPLEIYLTTLKSLSIVWRKGWLACLIVSLLLCGLLAGCGNVTTASTPATGGTTQAVTTIAGSTTVAATTATTAAVTTATVANPTATVKPTIPAGDFENPVLAQDFPDPYVLRVGNTFYAYATNAGGKKIQVTTSTDLINWKTPTTDALPVLPPWATANSGLVWAPEVAAVSGHYNLYFTARDFTSDKQCVGVATGNQPDSFQSSSDKPLVCHPEEGGDIDQDVFRDSDGKLYLYFKNDGNCCGQPTHIYVQPLSADGLSVTGQPTQLLTNDMPWEGSVIEAPTMFKHANQYYLFFSANNYANDRYAVGYATCQSVSGPCQEAPENPILKSDTQHDPAVIGPGHQALLQLGDQTWIFYHAWEATSYGTKGDRRLLWMDKVNWVNGKPVVQGPTTAPQPDPTVSP